MTSALIRIAVEHALALLAVIHSGRTTNFHVRNTHKKKRIKASFTICIDVGNPPPGRTAYTRTITPGKRTAGPCGNRGRITGGKYVD